MSVAPAELIGASSSTDNPEAPPAYTDSSKGTYVGGKQPNQQPAIPDPQQQQYLQYGAPSYGQQPYPQPYQPQYVHFIWSFITLHVDRVYIGKGIYIYSVLSTKSITVL